MKPNPGNLAELTGARAAASEHPNSGQRAIPDDMLNIIRGNVAPAGRPPSHYAGEDMLEALAFFQNPPCVLATGSETGLSAELPFGDFTSLLQMKTGETNLWHGCGLLTLLSFPAAESGQENVAAARLALELNELELASLTRCHFLGSWCPGRQALTFVSFLPNVLRREKLAQVLVGCHMLGRARWVTEEVFGVGFDYDRAFKVKAKQVMSLTPEGLAAVLGQRIAEIEDDQEEDDPTSPPELEKRDESASENVQERAAALLAQARGETQGDCQRPCTLFPAAPALVTAKEIVPLLSCGIFNPLGPTVKTILLVRTTAEADWLLVDVQSNPFKPTEATGRAWQPAELNPAQLGAVLIALAEAAREGESNFLLPQSTFVAIFPQVQVGTSVWKEVFRRGMIAEGITGLGSVCKSMPANWCKPWDRARKELGGDASESRPDRPLSAEGFYGWWGARLDDAFADPEDQGRMIQKLRGMEPKSEDASPVTATEFEDWWQLVTHPGHVAHEVKALPAAWQGALDQAPGMALMFGGDPTALSYHGQFLESVLSSSGTGAEGVQ
jgi:hypothetical protein